MKLQPRTHFSADIQEQIPFLLMQRFPSRTGLHLCLPHPMHLWKDVLLSRTCRALPTVHHSFNPPHQNQVSPTKCPFPPLCFHPHRLHPLWRLLQPHQEEKKQKHKKQDPWKHIWLLYNLLCVCKINTGPNSGKEPQGTSCLLLTLELPPTNPAQCTNRLQLSWVDGWPPRLPSPSFWCLDVHTKPTNLPATQRGDFFNFYSKTDSVLHLLPLIYCY